MNIGNICKYIMAFTGALLLGSCSADIPDSPASGRGVRAYAEVEILDLDVAATTRAVKNSNDKWGVSAFEVGDKMGMYALTGMQNPDDPDDFTLSVTNGVMYCEGKTGTAYRFGNSDIILDPTTVNSKNSKLFYPYYAEMPDPLDATPQAGLPLRETDPEDGVEKCIDFMYTTGDKISVSNGVMKPTFKHQFSYMILQRGNGFDQAEDRRIWVVTKQPYTDIRVTQASPTAVFEAKVQYTPDGSGEDPMTYIIDGESKFKVNKYCIWEAWEGNPYGGIESRYAIIPPGEVYFIFIQDNYGNWQNVTDFYLASSGSRTAAENAQYQLTISIVGVNVVARPVSVLEWDEETVITDDRDVGIDDFKDYQDWATAYNSYIESGRDYDAYAETLALYGTGVTNTETGRTSWTFYINSAIDFPPGQFVQVRKLDDTLEGSSTYTRYPVTGLTDSFIGEITENGKLSSLEFPDIYMVRPDAGAQPFSPITGFLNGGTVEKITATNCIVITEAPVGIIAGRAAGGSVKGCILWGDIIGTESAGNVGLFGIADPMPGMSGNNLSGLKFIEN